MSDAYLEKIAGELADLALADEKRSDDEKIVAEIAEIVGASSQTLQEAFLTAVRVRRAEKRARSLLTERATAQIAKTQRLLTDETDHKKERPFDTPNRGNDTALQDLLNETAAQPDKEARKNVTTDGTSPIAMPGQSKDT
jgi:hypothetical protein